MKKMLITGAGGFIGGFIVEEALKKGYETYAGVRKSTNREYLKDERIHFTDLCFDNKEKLKQQLTELKEQQGPWDYIVHNLGVTKCKNPDDFDKINTGYVKIFADALIETGMKPQQFILMSSLGAWGAGDEKNFTPIHPDDIPNPETRYGSSKLNAENYLRSLDNFPFIVLRPTGVYGPREQDYFLMMKTIKYGFDFVAGYKPQIITFIYVKDLVRVIFLAIEKGVTQRCYFISDGGRYRSSDFRRYIARELGRKWVIPVQVPLFMLKGISYVAEFAASVIGKPSTLNRDKYRIMRQRNWICDTSPLCRELGFKPEYDLERGVKESVIWYKQAGWL